LVPDYYSFGVDIVPSLVHLGTESPRPGIFILKNIRFAFMGLLVLDSWPVGRHSEQPGWVSIHPGPDGKLEHFCNGEKKEIKF